MRLGAFVSFFVMSGAGGWPTLILKATGVAAALVHPAFRGLVKIVKVLQRETRDIWDKRKAERKAGHSGEGNEFLSVLCESIL